MPSGQQIKDGAVRSGSFPPLISPKRAFSSGRPNGFPLARHRARRLMKIKKKILRRPLTIRLRMSALCPLQGNARAAKQAVVESPFRCSFPNYTSPRRMPARADEPGAMAATGWRAASARTRPCRTISWRCLMRPSRELLSALWRAIRGLGRIGGARRRSPRL
jgi:hypothetical protein